MDGGASMTPLGFVAVAAREVAWIWRDKVAVVLTLIVPLLAFALLAATFSHVVVRNLRVDVVDQDRTPTSTLFVQAIQSAPGVEVTERSSDLNGAMHAVRSGDAIAAIYLPRELERDVMGGRRPQVVIFYNKQFFTAGNIAASGLQAAVTAAAKSIPGGKSATASATPGPLVVEQYVLTNPALNYAQFLLRSILPTVLHMLVALAGGYAVGSEFSSRSKDEWLATAGGSPMLALVGKLAPYFAVYAVMAVVGMFILNGFYGVPFRGNALMVSAAVVLLIIAYLSLGALFQLLTRSLATGLSLASIVCSPAFGFAGVGFPVMAMTSFAQAWGALLPLRWYVQVLFDQAARGVPVADSALPFAILAGLAIVYFGFCWLRLVALAKAPAPAPEVEPEEPPTDRRGIVAAFSGEYGRVLRDRGIFSLIVLGPILYGVLYPQPYIGQLLRDIPIAVVDNDSSEVSRTLVDTLDAHEALEVTLRPTTLAEAQAALGRREVFGIVSIPAGTEREVLKGDEARLPAFVDSTYFLLYNRTLQGILEAAGTVSADLISRGARADGSLFRASLASSSPVEILSQPLFNPTGGYGSYVVPAAFVLILQQTLLLGAATAGSVAYQRGGAAARRRRGDATAVIGQALAHLMLALPGFALYLIILPRIYGFSSDGRLLDMLAMVIPFILSVSFLGQFVGVWFPRRETGLLLIVAFSLPLFFLVGVAWPVEAIPEMLRRASYALPSTSGIDGLVRLNQMGASLSDVSRDWHHLWILVALYAVMAMAAARLSTAGRSQ